MRILMAAATYPPHMPGGAQISAVMLANLIQDAGHDIRVVHVCDDDKLEMVDGIEVKRIASPNIYWNYFEPHAAWQKAIWHLQENGNPKTFLAMRREITDFEPDLLLTVSIENTNVASWAAGHSLGIPVAHTAFNSFLLCWNGVMLKKGRSCQGQCTECKVTSIGKRFMTRYVDAVIGESEDVLNRHKEEEYFPNAAMRRIPAAIERVVATEPRTFPKNRPLRFGFLGAHTEFKGLGTLAEAAAMLPADLPVEFIIAGKGEDAFAREIPNRFPTHNSKFIGWTKPDDFFAETDVLIYPSLGREAFGRSSIEAFAHAVPVLATSIGGVAENIKAGENGFHFAPGSASEIAELIEKVAGDPALYQALSAGALASATEYTRQNIGASLSDFLCETVSRHQAKRAVAGGQVTPAA